MTHSTQDVAFLMFFMYKDGLVQLGPLLIFKISLCSDKHAQDFVCLLILKIICFFHSDKYFSTSV